MFEVFYYARCGNGKSTCQNTVELAKAIAAELGVMAEDIIDNKNEPAKDAFIFLGCGCYGDKGGSKLSHFIAENNFKGRQVALFGTSLTDTSNKLKRAEELLKPAGAVIKGHFYCTRKSLPFLHKSRLSKEELTSTREFVNEMKIS